MATCCRARGYFQNQRHGGISILSPTEQELVGTEDCAVPTKSIRSLCPEPALERKNLNPERVTESTGPFQGKKAHETDKILEIVEFLSTNLNPAAPKKKNAQQRNNPAGSFSHGERHQRLPLSCQRAKYLPKRHL